jgi:hypothetical protein
MRTLRIAISFLLFKEAIGMSQGFTVRSSGLQAGSQEVADLQARCQVIAQSVVMTRKAMAGSAGHAGLATAFNDAAGKGDRAYTGAWAAYGHTSQGLAASAKNYSSTEKANLNQISTVWGGLRWGPQP